jgi:hypothetical protein
VLKNYRQAVYLLVDSFNVNCGLPDRQGKTALHYAIQQGFLVLVVYFVTKQGVEITGRDV